MPINDWTLIGDTVKSYSIKIKYHVKDLKKIESVGGNNHSNWIDLYVAESVMLKKGDFALISLGISMKLPAGFEAHIAPRSSTFKTWGIIQTNGIGIIDNSYCGNNDIWKIPVYATHTTIIEKGDKICQFRIVEIQPSVFFDEVENMEDADRGGFGSTGRK